MSLSIVLPTYNEKDNISILIPKIENLFRKEKIDGEIIVIDDYSPDGTAEIALKLNKKYNNIKVIRKKKEGIGSALVKGYDNSSKEVIISMDADLSYNYKDIPRFLKKIDEGYDLVVGCRHLDSKNYEKKKFSTFLKNIVSRYGNKIATKISGINIHDFSANYRAIRKEVWVNLKTKEKSNSLLLEMIFAAKSKKYKITELQINFKERVYGKSKINFMKEAPKVFFKLLKFNLIYRKI